MIFKGKKIGVGDFIAFRTTAVLLPEVQAVVIRVEKNGVLEVLSTLLIPFGHNGRFHEKEITELIIVYKASDVIPRESRKNFRKGQLVSTCAHGKKETGRVVAAFDGIIVAKHSSGTFITGGASFFSSKRRISNAKCV